MDRRTYRTRAAFLGGEYRRQSHRACDVEGRVLFVQNGGAACSGQGTTSDPPLSPAVAVRCTVVPASNPSASRRGFGITMWPHASIWLPGWASLISFAISNCHWCTLTGNREVLRPHRGRDGIPTNPSKPPGESVIPHLSGKIVVYFGVRYRTIRT